MKTLIYITILLLSFSSCQNNNEKHWNTIKEQADYKLIEGYIIRHPDTKHLHDGLNLIFKLKKQEDNTRQIPTCPNYYGRNMIRVIINDKSEIKIISEFINGNIKTDQLDSIYHNYLTNPEYDPNLPEIIELEVRQEKIRFSKGHFAIIIDNQANKDSIAKVIAKTKEALLNYKNHLLKENDGSRDKINNTIDYDSLLYNKVSFYNKRIHDRTTE